MIGRGRLAVGSRLRLPDGAAPLLSLAGVPVALLLALALCWPMVASGHLIAFADTHSYLKGGDAIWRVLGDAFLPAGASDATGAAAPAGAGAQAPEGRGALGDTSNLYGRSITYAALFSAVVRTAGPGAAAYLQALMVSFAILALISRAALERPALLVAGLVLVVAASQVAWMSVFLMPDVLGAVVLIYAALLASRFWSFGPGQKVFLTLLAAYAVSTHYGNMPLAAAVVVGALVWRAVARPGGEAPGPGRAAIASGLLVVAAAPILNLVASFAVLGEISVTPLRPPVVLARSIEDGPARWYLEDRCAEDDSAYCKAFAGEMPQNHYDFLWGERGLAAQDARSAESVRDNEWRIVLAAALEYPGQQVAAFARNTATQLLRVGETGFPMEWSGGEFVRVDSSRLDWWAMQIMPGVTFASALLLAGLLLSGRLDRQQVAILAVIVFGLVVNAFIFGALSAPAGRYQARVAWLLPLLVVLFVAESGFRRRRVHIGER